MLITIFLSLLLLYLILTGNTWHVGSSCAQCIYFGAPRFPYIQNTRPTSHTLRSQRTELVSIPETYASAIRCTNTSSICHSHLPSPRTGKLFNIAQRLSSQSGTQHWISRRQPRAFLLRVIKMLVLANRDIYLSRRS